MGVITYQIMNFSFIRTLNTDNNLLWCGYAFVSFQLICIIVLNQVNQFCPNFLKPSIESTNALEEE